MAQYQKSRAKAVESCTPRPTCHTIRQVSISLDSQRHGFIGRAGRMEGKKKQKSASRADGNLATLAGLFAIGAAATR